MRFCLLDAVLEQNESRIVTIKHVSPAEEYLGDHFPDFPVLPGVLMLEAMVQAGRRLIGPLLPPERPLVLGGVRAVKYGRFVQPGDTLRVEVVLLKKLEDGSFDLRGEGTVVPPEGREAELSATAVSGRFSLRPARVRP